MRSSLYRRRIALLGATALVGAVSPALAATPVWNGATSTDWFDPNNWTPAATPTNGDITTIRASNPVVVGGATANTFDLHVADQNGASVTLTVNNGGVLNVTNSNDVAGNPGSSATVTVTGAGSAWNPHAFTLGAFGTANVSILNGAHVSGLGGNLATGATGVANVTIDGAGSLWTATNNISMGSGGTATLNITNGGHLVADQTLIGGQNSVVTITGAGSLMQDNSFTNVGVSGSGATLNVLAGASLQSGGSTIGGNGSGKAVIDGAGTTWAVTNNLTVGGGSFNGALTLSNGSVTTVNGSVGLNGGGGATGVLNIGAAANMAAAAPGALTAAFMSMNSASTQLVFNHTSANYTLAAAISGSGGILQQAGTTHLTGNSNTFTGTTSVTGGVLAVDGTLTGAVNVSSGGALAGTGFIANTVNLPDGAALNIAQGQTLTFGTDLVLSNATNINATLGAPGGATPLVSVGGNLTLDGVLNVTAAGGFGAGTYRLMNYGGALTDNTLGLGALPGGTMAAQYSVQTAVAHQVNLVYTGAAPPPPPPPPPGPPPAPPPPPAPVGPFIFWEGAGAAHGDGQISGGAGTWTAASTMFANVDGTGNAPLAAPNLFPIFTAQPGVVTVDARGGPVRISGLQFAVDGYRIEGDALDLVGTSNTLRVGDGTRDGAGYQAVIASVLQGSGGIDKNDLGTLTLTGANTFTGATKVSAGVLALADGGSLSASSGVVDNAVFDVSAATGPVSIQSLNGTGRVDLGANTLALTQAQGAFDGALHGSGALALQGGQLALTGDSDFTGGVTVAKGAALTLGGGDAGGSVVGPVVDDGVLAFNRSDDAIFAGPISGAGAVQQLGSGSVRLSGANTYAGGTDIEQGSLIGSAAAFGAGAILAHGRLVLDQAADAAFANRLDGDGRIDKAGAGSLSVTGGGGFTGELDVLQGRLGLNSDLSGAHVLVAAGATLGGNGKMASLTAASGAVVAPGNSIGRLVVAGDYAQAAGAIFRAEVSSTAADQLVVGGVARLAPGAKLQVVTVGAGGYQLGQAMPLLQAAGGVQGQFTLDGPTTLTPFMGLALRYTGTQVMLEAVKTQTFASAATARQGDVAAAIDSLGGAAGVNQALARLPTVAAAQAAFDQLSGDLHASALSGAVHDAQRLRDSLAAHIDAPTADGRGLWAVASGGWGVDGARGGAASVRRRSAGALVGIDLPISESWRAGVFGGWGRFNLSSRPHAAASHGGTYSLGGYMAWSSPAWSAQVGAAQTWSNQHLSRSVAFDSLSETLRGGPDLQARQVFAKGAYRLPNLGAGVRAVAEAAYVSVLSERGAEQGGVSALAFARRTQAVAVATVGLEDEVQLTPNLKAKLGLAWRGAAGDTTPTLKAAFAGGSAFDVRGAPIASNAAVAQAALTGRLAKTVDLDVGYTVEAARRTSDQNLHVGVRWRF